MDAVWLIHSEVLPQTVLSAHLLLAVYATGFIIVIDPSSIQVTMLFLCHCGCRPKDTGFLLLGKRFHRKFQLWTLQGFDCWLVGLFI
jgi:hypothetical protein